MEIIFETLSVSQIFGKALSYWFREPECEHVHVFLLAMVQNLKDQVFISAAVKVTAKVLIILDLYIREKFNLNKRLQARCNVTDWAP